MASKKLIIGVAAALLILTSGTAWAVPSIETSSNSSSISDNKLNNAFKNIGGRTEIGKAMNKFSNERISFNADKFIGTAYHGHVYYERAFGSLSNLTAKAGSKSSTLSLVKSWETFMVKTESQLTYIAKEVSREEFVTSMIVLGHIKYKIYHPTSNFTDYIVAITNIKKKWSGAQMFLDEQYTFKLLLNRTDFKGDDKKVIQMLFAIDMFNRGEKLSTIASNYGISKSQVDYERAFVHSLMNN